MPIDLATLRADVVHVLAGIHQEGEVTEEVPLDLRTAALCDRLRMSPRTWSIGTVLQGRGLVLQVRSGSELLGYLLVEHAMLSSLTQSAFEAWTRLRRRFSPPLSDPAMAWNLMIHPSVQGTGLGRLLLAVGAAVAARDWNAPFTGGVAIGLTTTVDARRTWASLAAILPHAETGLSPLQPSLPGIPIVWGGGLLPPGPNLPRAVA